MALADRPRSAPTTTRPGLDAARTAPADSCDSARPAPRPDLGPLVSSCELFAGGRQLRIAHHGQTYTLRITRENKLILTK